MKTRLIILFAFLSTIGFAQSSGGGFTSFSKVRITTDPTSNPLRGKLLVRDTVTGNIDKILYSDLATAISPFFPFVSLTTAGTSGASTLSAGNLNIPRYDLYADGKVAQSITDGVTDSSPSQNQVFDGLALKANLNGGNTFTGTQLMPIVGVNTTTPLSGVPFNVGNPTSINAQILPSVAIQSMGNNIQGVTMENTSTGTNAEMRFIAKANDPSYLFFTQPSSNNVATTFFGVPKNTGSFIMNTQNGPGGSIRNMYIGTLSSGSLHLGTTNQIGMSMDNARNVSFVNPVTIPTATLPTQAVNLGQVEGLVDGVDLQTVLDNGKFADFDSGNAEVAILEGGVNNRYSYISSNNGLSGLTEQGGLFRVKNDNSVIQNTFNGFFGSFEVNEGIPVFSHNVDDGVDVFSSSLSFIQPTSNSNIKIPSPTVGGDYNLPILINGVQANDDGELGLTNLYQDNEFATTTIGIGSFGAASLSYFEKTNSYSQSLTLNATQTTLNSENPDYEGFVGSQFYNKLNNPNAFAQLGDIATGWQQITDATYTVGSPLSIAQGVTGKIQTGTVTTIDTQLPSDVTTFWNNTTDKLVGVNDGDSYSFALRFKAKMSVANGYADIRINIGGALNVISSKTILFHKGADTEQRFEETFTYFTGSTFIANGGDIEVIPLNGDIEIYDIVLLPVRTHKGK